VAQEFAAEFVGLPVGAVGEADRDVDRDDRVGLGDQVRDVLGEMRRHLVGEADGDPAGLARVHAQDRVG
jgi:hypothetical protein